MEKVSLLFTNANILTLDKENTKAGSVAVADNKIIGIWQEATPPKDAINITEETKVVDLEGDTLIPGFIDTHNHILMYALMKDMVNCSTPPNKNIEDVLNRLKEKMEQTEVGGWITGYGYDDTLLIDNRHPTKEDLDKVSREHPILINHISGHLAVANSQALELAGLDRNTKDPQGGHYGRNETGELDGVLYETAAMAPVATLVPNKSKAEKLEMLAEVAKEYVGVGITTNTDAAVTDLESLDVHIEASTNKLNPMRTQLMVMHQLMRESAPFADYTAEELDEEISKRSNGYVRLDSAKMFQDGSIQGLTGALREPYFNNKDITGDLVHVEVDFQEEILDLHRRGFRIATHGNGDRAIGSILDAYEHAIEKHPRPDHLHRVEHVQTGTPDDLTRMKKLQVAGSFFINHVYYWGDRHEQIFLGPERGRRISPLKEAVDHELLFTLHSDCPITPISPLFSVWAAVNRITREGKVLGPEQRIDVITALKSMTIYGAELIAQEDKLGSIEVGKLADFAVLDKDPTIIEKEEIKNIKVKTTYIDGKEI